MATVNLYFGAGGTAGGAATSFATRTSSLTQLKSVMLANVTSADDVVLWGEGLIDRYVHSSWAAVSGIIMSINSTECVGRSLRLRSYSVLGGSETPLTFTDFYLYKQTGGSTADWTDTGSTTTRGTKIWSSATISVGANGMGRVFAARYDTDPNFTYKELWEGGNNYSATLGAAIWQNLDVVPGTDSPGVCWTMYNASGALDTKLYIACQVNPFTAFGVITLLSRGTASVLKFDSIPGLVIDPEVTTRGGGAYGGVYLVSCGSLTTPALIEPRVLNTHPYVLPMMFTGTFCNLYVAPFIDPEYRSVIPYYAGAGTAHNVGGNETSLHLSADLSAATGWPENGGVPGLVYKARASNGRVSRICDLLHAGVAAFGAAATSRFVRVEGGVEFDFSHVPYGRAIAFGNPTLVDVGAISVTSQPTNAQYVGGSNARFRLRGARFKSSNNVGDMIAKGTPWGPGENKTGTAAGFSTYSNTGGYTTGELIIEDCVFECQDGGLSLQVYGGVAFGGKVRIFNCVFIKPANLSNIPNLGVDAYTNGVLAYIATTTPAALPDQIEFINCVAIGYGPTPLRYISVTPAVNNLQALETMTVGVNVGWTKFATYDEFRQALSSGQLPHIKA